MNFKHEPVRPPENIMAAFGELEKILVFKLREGPATPEELLGHALAVALGQTFQVTSYLWDIGSVSNDELSVPVVMYALGINPLTGKGRNAALLKQDDAIVVGYFPGYNLETRLRDFLMQEYPLPDEATKEWKAVAQRGNMNSVQEPPVPHVFHPRKNYVNHVLRRLWALGRSYHVRMPKEMTIGAYLKLPSRIHEQDSQKPVVELLGMYEFTSAKMH